MNYDIVQVCYIVMTLMVAGLTLLLPKLVCADASVQTQVPAQMADAPAQVQAAAISQRAEAQRRGGSLRPG